jgi:glycosyltransferase involved in cell wall biosynthesis
MDAKTIIFVNYQRTIPPYLLNEINSADNFYDNILYVSPRLKNDNRAEVKSSKVKFCLGNRLTELASFLLLPFYFLKKISFSNIKMALKTKKLSFCFLKEHAHYLYELRTLLHLLKKFTKRIDGGIIIASWFNSCALASGMFCRNKTNFKSYSFAHAFEVNPNVSKNLGATFEKYKIMWNEKIFFISKTIKELCLNYLSSLGINISDGKVGIRYLGVSNQGQNPSSSDKDAFTILSCSNVTPLKRVKLIAESINKCTSNIKWFHIGDGPELEEVIRFSNLRDSQKTVFRFLGRLPNEKVFDFYRNVHIDLFINLSTSEGLPVSIMEAMSFGVPVLATDVGGTKEIVNSLNGFLIDLNSSPDYIASLIDSFANQHKENIENYRRVAKETWESNFNLISNSFGFYSKL